MKPICKECKKEITSQEQNAYRDKCEDCHIGLTPGIPRPAIKQSKRIRRKTIKETGS